MIALWAAVAVAGPVLTLPGPEPGAPLPPPPSDSWGVVDLGDVVVVRPVGETLVDGFDLYAFDQAVAAAVQGRDTLYDFVVLMNTDNVATQFPGAAAFYLAYNNDDLEGTGVTRTSRGDRPARGALWMSSPGVWQSSGEAYTNWVFGQELGHHWLSFVDVDIGEGPEDLLLGRSNSHWSWYFDTGASPVEGNRWIDHGDGTFTTDVDAGPGVFSDLDLYLMGLIEPEEVAPFFVIEPEPSASIEPGTPPDWLYGGPTTVSGRRIDLRVQDVIAAEGLVSPGPDESDKHHELLTVLVVGPKDLYDEADLADVARFQDQWTDWWVSATDGLSEIDFSLTDEGLTPNPPPIQPAMIPRGAW